MAGERLGVHNDMPGLLAQLDLEIGNFDVGSILGGVIGQLGALGDSVGGLTSGPGPSAL